MAFGTKYRCEFSDILEVDWQIDIQEDPDPGSIITLQASGDAMAIQWYGEDDLFDQNIMGSMMNLNVESVADFALLSLFTSETLKYKVIVYQDSIPFWYGYILPNNYQEPYDHTPFMVTLTASDGLGLLKDFEFKDLGYEERQTVSQVIFDILSLVDITTFTEYINIYESTMNATVNDSPLDQCGIDPDLFKDENCYTALDQILKTLNAGIKQDQGEFIIYRFKEVEEITMYGRIFTSGTVKTSTTKTPAQYINRTGQSSDLYDFEGGMITMYKALKEINILQDFRTNDSFLKTYDFPYDSFTYNSTWDITDWTLSSGTIIAPVSVGAYSSAGEKNGILINNADVSLNHNIFQVIKNIKNTSDLLNITFEFAIYTESGSPSGSGYAYAEIQNYNDGGTIYYLKNVLGVLSWTTTPTQLLLMIDVTEQYDVIWETKIYKTAIPYDDNLKIILYAGKSTGDYYTIWKSVSMTIMGVAAIYPDNIEYKITNSINGQTEDKEYILGDGFGTENDHLQYKGSLNVLDGVDPIPTSLQWNTRNNTENMPLIKIIGNELGNQYIRSKMIIDLPLREMSGNAFLSLTGNLQDILNQVIGDNRIFAISNGVFNVKDREWQLVLTEMIFFGEIIYDAIISESDYLLVSEDNLTYIIQE